MLLGSLSALLAILIDFVGVYQTISGIQCFKTRINGSVVSLTGVARFFSSDTVLVVWDTRLSGVEDASLGTQVRGVMFGTPKV